MLKPLLNALGFQLGWFTCVLGASWGYPWAGPLAAALFLTVHAGLVDSPRSSLRCALLIGVIGFLVDSLLGATGVLGFRDGLGPGWICPPWLVALWMLFSTTPELSLRWLHGRWGLAAVLGAIFGPLSYYVGETLGALTLGASRLTSLLVLATVWAAALPLLLMWSGRCVGAGALPSRTGEA